MPLITPPESHTTTWDIDGQKFNVNSEIIDKIIDAMWNTSIDHNEYGNLFCDTGKELISGKMCHGDQCSVQITDCKGKGNTIGSFHSHPEIISFSLPDYIIAAMQAHDNPQKRSLMCVGLGTAGVRCKAVKEVPPEDLIMNLSGMMDSEQTRDMIKPYFTKKVNISVQQLKQLQNGTPWDKLPKSETVIAIDEGDDKCAGGGHGCVVTPEEAAELTKGQDIIHIKGGLKGLVEQLGKNMGIPPQGDNKMAKKSLIEVAKEYIKEPSGKYPWDTKEITASVLGPGGGIGIEAKQMPELISRETQFIKTVDVEIPDPKMIHYGEVAQYIAAISPIILQDAKDKDGKYKILDGRHRLAAWRAAGYTQIPVVFTKEADYK